ncbi:MAG: WbqC family protein [Bacteroidota bacterium]
MAVLFTTAYFPSVSYMAEVLRADDIVIEAFESYTKQTCRNHCTIFGPNGQQTLSIPVIRTNGNHTLTKDILISEHQPWQKIHWRSIETAYNNSPFFLYYQDHFVSFFEKNYRFLIDLNTEILKTLIQLFKINRSIRFTTQFEKSPLGIYDYRTVFGAKYTGQNSHLQHYTQVFESRHGFIPGLSILDVIFNLGPEALPYLETI